jgi:formate hydrogenlyase subunit 3/multisubunit Na+/H+ antiporter MnhD subunit
MMACHAGAALLILLFFFPHTPGWMFLLAVAGFGLKIGFPLLHVWLPEAHPAAPAPVSALMSGAMIELGFFGVLLFGISPDGSNALYGWSFLILGLITAPCGIIFAIAQSNLKKLLAYSSIENMGILSCALGLGFLGAAYGLPEMMVSGLLGGAIHLLNHALLKGGLFLGSGSVYKACGTLDMDEMGGLLKRMPRTGAYFILHALSLCGLPPGSGFAGEFLIYLAAFTGLASTSQAVVAASAATLIILALTGGLAAAAFAKVIGAVFCGEPRSKGAADAEEMPFFMNLPIMLLQLASWVLLLTLPLLLDYAAQNIFAEYDFAITPLALQCAKVALICFALTVITLGVFALRQMLIRKNGQRVSLTWDCGYSVPSAKMQYTATSFSQNPVDFFRLLLHPERKIEKPQGIFPEKAALEESVDDGGIRCFWRKIFRVTGKFAEKTHALQSGSLHFYLLVMVLTLIGMLFFAVTGGNGK